VAKNSDVLFVSVKPQYVHQVLTDARPGMTDDTLIISIAAGITGVCSDRQQHTAKVYILQAVDSAVTPTVLDCH